MIVMFTQVPNPFEHVCRPHKNEFVGFRFRLAALSIGRAHSSIVCRSRHEAGSVKFAGPNSARIAGSIFIKGIESPATCVRRLGDC